MKYLNIRPETIRRKNELFQDIGSGNNFLANGASCNQELQKQ